MKAFIVSVSIKINFSLFIVGLDIYLVYNRIFSTLIHRFVVQVKMKELSAMEMKEEVFPNSIISQNYKKGSPAFAPSHQVCFVGADGEKTCREHALQLEGGT